MSFTIPNSEGPSAKPPFDRGELVSVPYDNRVFLDPLTGSSTVKANSKYDQIEDWFSFTQTDPQPNFPPREASTTEFFNYTQHNGSEEGHFTHQAFTKEDRRCSIANDARPFCASCNKYYGRIQELERHVKEVHMPWRRCPFCDFMWIRPGKIKNHIMVEHSERFTAEMLKGIRSLCGRRIVEFIDGYDHGPDLEAALRSSP